jgi:succinate dehydrogenase / fumarate reductase iron-sulfur subunit
VSHTIKNITLKIWRQDGPASQGRFEIHKIDEITDEASFLEMLDILNDNLVHEGRSEEHTSEIQSR